MRLRRSRFELIIEILDRCLSPGLPKSQLGREAGVNLIPLSRILMELMTGELITVETRPHSFMGDKRETDFYVRTSDGDELIRDMTGIRERLATPGAQSGSGSRQ